MNWEIKIINEECPYIFKSEIHNDRKKRKHCKILFYGCNEITCPIKVIR